MRVLYAVLCGLDVALASASDDPTLRAALLGLAAFTFCRFLADLAEGRQR